MSPYFHKVQRDFKINYQKCETFLCITKWIIGGREVHVWVQMELMSSCFTSKFVLCCSGSFYFVSISIRSEAFLASFHPINSNVCLVQTEHGTFRSILSPRLIVQVWWFKRIFNVQNFESLKKSGGCNAVRICGCEFQTSHCEKEIIRARNSNLIKVTVMINGSEKCSFKIR